MLLMNSCLNRTIVLTLQDRQDQNARVSQNLFTFLTSANIYDFCLESKPPRTHQKVALILNTVCK